MGGYYNSNGLWVVTETGVVRLPINNFCLAAGTPLAAWADGVSSTPGLNLADSEAVGVRWNTDATPAAIWTQVLLPADRRPYTAITLHILASKVGATVGDAVTFLVTAFAPTVGALHDADANFGGTSSAMTGDATSKTVQHVTLTLAAADIPASPASMSLSIKPTNGTIGTDDVIIENIWLEYERNVTPT
jgi:hypothetical protein